MATQTPIAVEEGWPAKVAVRLSRCGEHAVLTYQTPPAHMLVYVQENAL